MASKSEKPESGPSGGAQAPQLQNALSDCLDVIEPIRDELRKQGKEDAATCCDEVIAYAREALTGGVQAPPPPPPEQSVQFVRTDAYRAAREIAEADRYLDAVGAPTKSPHGEIFSITGRIVAYQAILKERALAVAAPPPPVQKRELLTMTPEQWADCQKIGGSQVEFVNRCSWLLREVYALQRVAAPPLHQLEPTTVEWEALVAKVGVAAVNNLARAERAEAALEHMMRAYERRIRSLCSASELQQRPWESEEFMAGREVLKAKAALSDAGAPHPEPEP